MTDRPIRASDQERESVVDVLRDAFTDGRLTFDEFEERTAAAYAAKTWTELRELTSDLPAQPLLGAGLDHRPQDLASPHRRYRPRSDRAGSGATVRSTGCCPCLFVWIVISAAAGSPYIAVALSFVFICVLATRIGYGGRW